MFYDFLSFIGPIPSLYSVSLQPLFKFLIFEQLLWIDYFILFYFAYGFFKVPVPFIPNVSILLSRKNWTFRTQWQQLIEIIIHGSFFIFSLFSFYVGNHIILLISSSLLLNSLDRSVKLLKGEISRSTWFDNVVLKRQKPIRILFRILFIGLFFSSIICTFAINVCIGYLLFIFYWISVTFTIIYNEIQIPKLLRNLFFLSIIFYIISVILDILQYYHGYIPVQFPKYIFFYNTSLIMRLICLMYLILKNLFSYILCGNKKHPS